MAFWREDGHSGAIWAQRVNPDSFDVLAGTGSVAKRGLNYVDDGISAAAQSVGNTTKQVTDSLGGVAAGATSIVGSLFG
ncbi:hypothetical protein [Streptomyces xinghaiensis]|uniref:hypothetical protein n=1 Tax=Streptomyces xinghaiensis TaxID=1038928 RepID=UPI002E0DB583|nr:hypothetical protein OG463_24465 [Streptomyces xinghaiensis]